MRNNSKLKKLETFNPCMDLHRNIWTQNMGCLIHPLFQGYADYINYCSQSRHWHDSLWCHDKSAKYIAMGQFFAETIYNDDLEPT
jgi:hypothetical protein